MSGTLTTVAQRALVPLEWECNHFGLSVAQLTIPECADAELESVLQLARQTEVRLVVWPAHAGRVPPDSLLSEFGGMLVDRKATFTKSLLELPVGTARKSCPFAVVPYAGKVVSPALAALAISAGIYSRFHVDPHFSPQSFEAMYRVWIERSVSGEMADVVLVVPLENRSDCEDELGGMVTISQTDDIASIGLIAVAAAVQGLGIGSALMEAAHSWMRIHGARQARVVTQQNNLPACRLYERAGYQLSRVQPYYHFWL